METPSILKVTHPSTLVSMVNNFTFKHRVDCSCDTILQGATNDARSTSVTDGEKKGRNEKSKPGGNNFYTNVSYVQ